MIPSICRAVALTVGVLAASGVVAAREARGDYKAEIRREGPDRTPSDVHQYLLRPLDDGTFFYDGLGFSAVIAKDGAVEFHSKEWTPRSRFVDIITNTGEGRKPLVWPYPLPSGYRVTPYDYREEQVNALRPELPAAEPIFVDAGGRFDITDAYASARGQNLYTSAEITFLSDTFDLRMKMAAQSQRQILSQALAELPDRLNVIWTDPQLSPAERRQVIYLLWQETASDETGAGARQIIAAFAAKNFPPAEAQRFER
jgi:hypothetical protein